MGFHRKAKAGATVVSGTESKYVQSTNALFTIPHGLGKTPTGYGITMLGISSSSSVNYRIRNITADETNIKINVTLSNAFQTVNVEWFACI